MIDNIFEMEWLTLNKNKKKSLIIIMRRTIVPIQITCAYIIPMNLDSFMGVSIDITETNFTKFYFQVYLNMFLI